LSEDERRLPPDVEEPVFSEPWEAQVFAITVHLHEADLISWPEWASSLSSHVRSSDAAPNGHDYYEHWLHALEDLLREKGFTDDQTLDAMTAAWHRAAHATPHGKPILLENDPQHAK